MDIASESLISQLNRMSEARAVASLAIAPVQSSSTYSTEFQENSFNKKTISDFSWTHRFFEYNVSDTLLPLTSDIFGWAKDRIRSESTQSVNGNLSIIDVLPNYIHSYSTYIYKNNPYSLDITPDWSDSIGIYINNDPIIKSNYNAFTTRTVPIILYSGWNELKILLYTKSLNKNFSINSEIGSLADDWINLQYDLPEVPTNLSVSIDVNSLNNRKDPNTIVIKWDKMDSFNTAGYNIYRTGPYITGITVPVINKNTSSGYFVSGVLGIDRESYYQVSAYSDNFGETLPSESIAISLSPHITGVYSVSGISSFIHGSGLISGGYFYVVGAAVDRGFVYSNISPSDSSYYFENDKNAVLLSWSGVENVSKYEIYRYPASSFISDSFCMNGLTSGNFIATVYPPSLSYFDTGVIGIVSSGFKPLDGDIIDRTLEKSRFIANVNNAAMLNWSGVNFSISGIIGYKVYRTYYSGIYQKNSLVGVTTNLFIIDSGIYSGSTDPLAGKPTSIENIASLSYLTNKFKDTSIVKNQSYSYSLSTYNERLLESSLTTGCYIIAGDQIAPSTPTNITITSFNGFATLGWVNGGESDLAGTIIYQSGLSGHLEIARTTANSYTQFIGYSGSPWFKLGNYDTSDNISVLSSAYQGSGTFVAENIILKSFRTLSSLDVDLELYVPSGFNTSNSAMTRMQMGAIHCPSGVYQTYTVSAPPFLGLGLERFAVAPGSIQYSTYSPDDVLGGTVAIPVNSGFGFAAIEESRLNRYHLLNVAYYSGRIGTANLYLENMCFEGKSGAPSIAYTLLSGNTTGIFVGDWILNQWPYGDNEYSNALMNPVVVTNSGFVDKQVIIYVSGTSSTNTVSFGFTSSNRSGTYIGPEKYLTIDGADISPRDGFSSAMDYDGNIHLFYMGSGLSPSTNKLRWFKLDYQTKNNNPITILASGSYTNNGKGGYLFPQETNPFILGEPRVFIDELNNIYIFQKGNRSNAVVAAPFKKTIFASQIDKNGNIQVFPDSIYQLPFEFESTWGISYTPVGNLAYSWYTLGKTATGSSLFPQRNLTYNYQAGVYRRMHPLEFYNNSSLYQILQSIIK